MLKSEAGSWPDVSLGANGSGSPFALGDHAVLGGGNGTTEPMDGKPVVRIRLWDRIVVVHFGVGHSILPCIH